MSRIATHEVWTTAPYNGYGTMRYVAGFPRVEGGHLNVYADPDNQLRLLWSFAPGYWTGCEPLAESKRFDMDGSVEVKP